MRRLILIIALVALGGCATMAPERERPAMPVPGAWTVPAEGPTAEHNQNVDELGWRDVFADPALQELIETALDQNRSLRQAVLAMDKARAQHGIARADRLPGVDASGRNSNTRSPGDLRGGTEGIDRQWAAGLGVTSFELDFFGQSRILMEQRYEAGLESAFALHDAERTLFSARQDLLAVRLARQLTTVELFAALGGGWQERGADL